MAGICIVGEAWGKDEELAQAPFVGMSGKFLRGTLSQCGIDMSRCFITNVFNLRPRPTNDIRNLCAKKADGIIGMPSLMQGKYVRAEYKPELDRLYAEIKREDPDLIIALGGTAAWALLHTSGIKRIRGATQMSVTGHKVLPTYHPAAVFRDWTLRPILLADLHKARRESEFRELRRPMREVWVEPSLDDLAEFERRYITPSDQLSIDIETGGDQITEIGFAPTKDRAIVVPFYDATKPGHNYWRTLTEELEVWRWVRRVCLLKKRHKVGQNFMYDATWLWKKYGIKIVWTDDTMLLHHSLQPEMEKGLAFLGSVYTDEAPWKFRRNKDIETGKTED